ncbi:MAG: hypothetical protein NTY36_03115 [Deltaproteobacteria bacterium]|nr:hypothetical protein [Deltaproteobacteria bacterium]
MRLLNEVQRQRALDAMGEFLSAPPESDGQTQIQAGETWDQERVQVIEKDLRPLLAGYLEGKVALSDFKSKVDGINKRHNLWGFKGIKGQMFFNMVVNVADDPGECDQKLKAVLAIPSSEQIASSRLKTFASYVKRLGDQWVEAGHTRHGMPKKGSIPFFVSYFWQIQERETWPVYYTNSVQIMTDLNLWQPSGDLAQDYLTFKHLHEELADLFTKESGQRFDLYRVEHVFWYRGGNPYAGGLRPPIGPTPPPIPTVGGDVLPESYVPPIIAILPRVALNEPTLVEAAQNSGTSLERAFEKYVNAAFTMLGYEAKLLGMGKGRVPDGLALARDENYAILWDAKIRTNGYSMGTDDRTIREYITTQSRDLKKKQSMKNIYYLIISSTFMDDYDDAIRSIKMDTDVNEVILMKVDALVAMVDAKLRAPLEVTLGPDGLQRLFSQSGILTSDTVRELLI